MSDGEAPRKTAIARNAQIYASIFSWYHWNSICFPVELIELDPNHIIQNYHRLSASADWVFRQVSRANTMRSIAARTLSLQRRLKQSRRRDGLSAFKSWNLFRSVNNDNPLTIDFCFQVSSDESIIDDGRINLIPWSNRNWRRREVWSIGWSVITCHLIGVLIVSSWATHRWWTSIGMRVAIVCGSVLRIELRNQLIPADHSANENVACDEFRRKN